MRPVFARFRSGWRIAFRKLMLVELERQDDVFVVRIQGRIVPGSDSEYLRLKEHQIKIRHCGKVLVDLCEVRSMGSAGINFVVSIFKNCGGRFVLACPHQGVRDVLALTHLSRVLPVAPDVVSGLAALRQIP
jgi:anti-anti-sigma factor